MRNGRNSITKFLLFLGLSFTLSSCIYDRFDENDGAQEWEDYAYFSVSIVFSDDTALSSTRAEFDGDDTFKEGDYFFNNGLTQESMISDAAGANWLLAYDNSGQLLLRLELTSFEETSSTTDNTGKSYRALCRVNPNREILNRISSLRIVLNSGTAAAESMGSVADLSGLQLTQADAGDTDYLFRVESGTRYHTMSSSMIVNGREATPAATIGEITYYPSAAEALNNPCATLYVERMQAKYTVLFHPTANSGTDQFFQDGEVWDYNLNSQQATESGRAIVFTPGSSNMVYYVTDYDNLSEDEPIVGHGQWKAAITGWGINGTEPSEYLFKSLGQSPVNFRGWNFTPTGYSAPIRNLWASDPHYNSLAEIYPDQYRRALDVSTTLNVSKVSQYEGNEGAYPLNYLSFNDLNKREIRQYSSENTYDASVVFGNRVQRLEERLQYRCGNHLFVGAQLLIAGLDPDDVYNSTTADEAGLIVSGSTGVSTKYYMNNIYWSEQAYINFYCKHMGNNLDATTACLSDLVPQNQPFIPNNVFTPANGEAKFYVSDGGRWRQADYRDFTIEPVYIIGGDGWCYPVPKTDPNNSNNTMLYVRQWNGSYRQISMEEYNKFAYGFPFYFAKCYNQGCMYYAVPISTNENREQMSNFGLVTGDYGAVRNHWYHYRFTNLNGVGVPVHDPQQPIIPNNEPSVLGLGFEVRIIPWHVVDIDVNI